MDTARNLALLAQVRPALAASLADANIAARAVLKNCILFDNVTVGRDVHLSNCILGANGNVKENITVYEAAVLNIRE